MLYNKNMSPAYETPGKSSKEYSVDLHDTLERFIKDAPSDMSRTEVSFSSYDLSDERKNQIAFPIDASLRHICDQVEPTSYRVTTMWENGCPEISLAIQMSDGSFYWTKNRDLDCANFDLYSKSKDGIEKTEAMTDAEASKLILSLALDKHQLQVVDEVRTIDSTSSEIAMTDPSVAMLFENVMTHVADQKTVLRQAVAQTEEDNRTIMAEHYQQSDGKEFRRFMISQLCDDEERRLIYDSRDESMRILELSVEDRKILSEEQVGGEQLRAACIYMIESMKRELNRYTNDYRIVDDF